MNFDLSPLVVAQWSCGLFVLGTIVGQLLVKWVPRMAMGEPLWPAHTCRSCGGRLPLRTRIPVFGYFLSRRRCPHCRQPLGIWIPVLEWGTGIAFVGLFLAMAVFDCQDLSPTVSPHIEWKYGRIAYHLILLSLLIAATATDFWDYVVPDIITVPGIFLGIALATFAADLQMIHLWVDWNQEVPGLAGPYIPEWIKNHPHWHGLAWSLAGAAAGSGLTWLVRRISSIVLGQEALGFGDVMLMAMIGAYVGWQPVIFVFALAPFCGLVVGMAAKLFSNKPYVPYGPFLAAAAVLVLMSWKWLWMWEPATTVSIRKLFGDAISLGILAGIALVSMSLLLVLVKLYRMIPGKRRHADSVPTTDSQLPPTGSESDLRDDSEDDVSPALYTKGQETGSGPLESQ